MKNIFKLLFVVLTMTLSLSSCRDNAEIPDHGPIVHPQEDVQGTYTGEWTKTEAGSTNVETGSGSLVFAPSDINYVTNVTVSCPDLDLNLSSVANIAPGGEGYFFSNTVKTNGFGAEFSGSVKKSDNTVWLAFKKTVKVGIKSRTYTYTFNGKKQ